MLIRSIKKTRNKFDSKCINPTLKSIVNTYIARLTIYVAHLLLVTFFNYY